MKRIRKRTGPSPKARRKERRAFFEDMAAELIKRWQAEKLKPDHWTCSEPVHDAETVLP